MQSSIVCLSVCVRLMGKVLRMFDDDLFRERDFLRLLPSFYRLGTGAGSAKNKAWRSASIVELIVLQQCCICWKCREKLVGPEIIVQELRNR